MTSVLQYGDEEGEPEVLMPNDLTRREVPRAHDKVVATA